MSYNRNYVEGDCATPHEEHTYDSSRNCDTDSVEGDCAKSNVQTDDSNPACDRNSIDFARLKEEQRDDSNPNCISINVEISKRSETCSKDVETNIHDSTEKHNVMDLVLKLGNDAAVYNISKSLERVRYIINSTSAEDITSVLPHQRCVTYISQAQKTLKGKQKENVFKFISSYPSSRTCSKKYSVKTGVAIIIIGDVTKLQEEQCVYVFICAYLNDLATLNSKAAKALGMLGAYTSSAEESDYSSDDDSSSIDSSENSADSASSTSCDSSDENEDENINKIAKKREYVKPLAINVRNPLVFLEDGAADKLPPVHECDIKVLRQDCIKIGYVMHIYELLVSVQGLKDSPALNAETLLFLEDSEDDKSFRSLGFVYEVIGPVDEPLYCITFKEEQSLKKKKVKQGESVYICPSPEYTHFVFVQDLLKQKGSDASWKNDVEPPEQFIEYSDDEEERLAKQKLKQVSSTVTSLSTAVKRKHIEGNKPKLEEARVYKRKIPVHTSVDSSRSSEVNCEVLGKFIPSVQSCVHPRTSVSLIASSCATGRGQQTPHAAQLNGEIGNRSVQSSVPPWTSVSHVDSYHVTGRGQRMPHAAQLNGEVGNRSVQSLVPSWTSVSQVDSYHATGRGQQMPHAAQLNEFGDRSVHPLVPAWTSFSHVTGRGQRMPHAARLNGEVGNRNVQSLVPLWTSVSHVDSYHATGRGQRMPHAAQLNGEVGNRSVQSLVPSWTSVSQVDSYHATGRGQQMPHKSQLNGEFGNRRLPSLVSSGTSDNQHSIAGSYLCRDQRTLSTVQVNDVGPPRLQHNGFALQPALTRPAGPVVQQPPRMQQYMSAPMVNRHFLPVPPASLPPRQSFAPPLQQHFFRSSPSHPRFTSLPSSQGQFYNPHQ